MKSASLSASSIPTLLPEFPHITDVTIDRLGGLGDGACAWNSKTLLIPKSTPGDHLSVRITHATSELAFGLIEAIIAPGAERVPAPCPHYNDCGACGLQHLSDDAYRAFKQRIANGALKRAGWADISVPVHFLPPATRRRVDMKITRDASGALRAAYNPPRSHERTPIDACLIMSPALAAFYPHFSNALRTLSNAPDSVQITAAAEGIDVVFTYARLPAQLQELPTFAEICAAKRVSARDEKRSATIVEHGPLTAGGIAFPPGAFLQASDEAQAFLTAQVVSALNGRKHIADLFCGIGAYALPLSACADVHAVEIDRAMLAGVQAHNRITAEARDLFKRPLTAQELNRFDGIVLNPPRAGAKAQCAELAKSVVPVIVMVSCSPDTFARDAAILTAGGYTLTHAAALDQFVWSAHLEIIGVFQQG